MNTHHRDLNQLLVPPRRFPDIPDEIGAGCIYYYFLYRQCRMEGRWYAHWALGVWNMRGHY